MTHSPHIPVLLDAVINSFRTCTDGHIVDCTLGYAGHSSVLLEQYPQLSLVGIDRDDEALAFSHKRLAAFDGRYRLYKGDFAHTLPRVEEQPITGILADFGVSSLQLDKRERGFSFESETLDMRMDQSAVLSAYEVVNSYTAQQLSRLFREYGEIAEADMLAEQIVRRRTEAPIQSGRALSQIAKDVLYSGGKIHPATRMFQAIRIEVNDELGQIEGLLNVLEKMRPSSAIVSLITFHSLEDRLVKNRFRAWAKSCICPPDAPRCTCGKHHALGKVLTRKPIVADTQECRINPRSRSAKLRCFQFAKANA